MIIFIFTYKIINAWWALFLFTESDRNNLEKLVIKINEEKETFNTNKKLPSNEKKGLISMGKQLVMILKQTLRKIIVTKTQLLILTIVTRFYKLMLIIMKLLQKAHWNTKIQITIKENYHWAKKSQNAPPNEKETSKKTKKNKKSSADCKRIYIIGVHNDIHNTPRLIFFFKKSPPPIPYSY